MALRLVQVNFKAREELGAKPAEVGQGDVRWTVLAEPEGNVFCVLSRR